ncbi:MAG: RcnB family protein, partial [Rhizobacter sp.]|nr:RcnB family protein [Rhizobacter sp.]
MTAGALLFGSVGAFAQAEAQQWQNERQNRGAERGGPYAPQPGNPNAQRNYYRAANEADREQRYNNGDARYNNRDSRYDPRYYQRWDQNQSRYTPYDRGAPDWHGRGAGPNHDWYRGSYLPREYRGRNYVVDDWRAHHLYAPPSGYHWVQGPGGDYLLVAVATGL